MYCRNCGVELIDDNSICVNCGTSKGVGTNYCNNCAAPTDENTSFCTNCGLNFGLITNEVVTPSSNDESNSTQNNTYTDNTSATTTGSTYSNNNTANNTHAPKSKIAAGLLGIFLGWLGVHRLYLGYTGIGIAQLVLGLLGFLTCGITTMISSIWGLIEGILIIVGSTITTDSDGNPLGD